MPKEKIKLLMVDDELEICDFVKIIFKKKNFSVFCATSGVKAVSLAKKIKPQICLLDIHMEKGINGIEALRRIKGILPDCLCIMVTWDSDKVKMEEAKSIGAVTYLTKPLTVTQLVKTVMKLSKRLEREAR
ncbi:MAG: response regulator [Candidatus Omnitrophota bacterium]